MHGFISERSAAGDYANITRGMNIPGHNADFALAWRDDARTVRTNQNSGAALHITGHFYHIQHRYPFGNTDDELQLRIHGFHNRISSKGRRNINYTGCRSRCSFGCDYRIKYRQTDFAAVLQRNVNGSASLSRGYPADHLCSVIQRAFGMEEARRAGNPLCDDFRIFVYKNAHSLGHIPI
ncbi:hypothetical protein D3C73_1055480 [compost metagenome]